MTISAWTISSSPSTPAIAGVGDVWIDNSYVDFSNPAVRAKFVSPTGTWLYMGVYGELPTGTSPLNWLRVQTGNTPADILIGYGQTYHQSAWTLLSVGVDPTSNRPYAAMGFDVCAPYVPPPLPGSGSPDALTVEIDEQREKYLAFRDKQFRKRQRQKAVAIAPAPQAVPVPVLAPALPMPVANPVPIPQLSNSLAQLHQQMTSARPLVPVAAIPPITPAQPAPTPTPPLTGLPSQLDALRQQMKTKR